MKNREERPTASDRGASQRTFDFGDEAESMLSANLLRPELTDPASIDTPSLSVSSETDLMEQVVDPRNLDRAWRQVKGNRGAPGPDGMTIKAFESWCPEHWPAVKQQLLDGTYRPSGQRGTGHPACHARRSFTLLSGFGVPPISLIHTRSQNPATEFWKDSKTADGWYNVAILDATPRVTRSFFASTVLLDVTRLVQLELRHVSHVEKSIRRTD